MYTIYKIQLYQSQQLFVLEMQFLYPKKTKKKKITITLKGKQEKH